MNRAGSGYAEPFARLEKAPNLLSLGARAAALGGLVFLPACSDPIVSEWELLSLADQSFPASAGASACSEDYHFSLLIKDSLEGELFPVLTSRISSTASPLSRYALPVKVTVVSPKERYSMVIQDPDAEVTLDCTRNADLLRCTDTRGSVWEFGPTTLVAGAKHP